MAGYNVKSLIDQVLDQAKDDLLPRSRVLSYLQRTQDLVLGRHRYKFSEDVATDGLSTGSVTYAPECDHQQIFDLVLNVEGSGTPIRPIYLSHVVFFDRFPLPDTSAAGQPEYYTDYGGDLYWDRPLSQDFNLTMRYLAASPRLKDEATCEPIIPQEFDTIYISGGLAGCEAYRENRDISAVIKREIEDIQEDLLGRYGLRKTQPGKARTTRRRITR